mgnify:CR=1 FL=1
MRKLVIIFMLVGIANIVRAQSPINSIYKEIREKWEQYNKDSITIEVGRMLNLFEKGGVFTQDIVEKNIWDWFMFFQMMKTVHQYPALILPFSQRCGMVPIRVFV